jgi:ABC-type sugar transport system permease subunit
MLLSRERMRYSRNSRLPVALVPALLFFGLMTVLPIGLVVYLSLHESNIITTTFVGLRNYVRIFTEPKYLTVVGNTILYPLFIVPVQMVLSLSIAFLIHAMPRGQHIARVIVYAPMLSAGIVISSAWRWIFHPRAGLVNWFISLVGVGPVAWFSTRWTAIPVISFIQAFTVCGSVSIIFGAALKSIGSDMIESAKIDGAGRWRMVWSIYLPAIASTVVLMLMVTTIGAMQIVEWVYMLAPHEGAATMLYAIYHEGFLYSRYGMASAMAVTSMVIISSIAFMQRRLQRWQST